jgi:RNA polymerase sigma-32 factor
MQASETVVPQQAPFASGGDVGLSKYIRTVRELPQLSREEETDLATRWAADGDSACASKLVNANLRHVVAIALSYRRYGLALADLISEGNFGIVHALKKFDPSRGVRFVTYAAYWIRAYILNFVIRSWSMVGVGAGALRSKVFFRMRRERARIAALVGEGGGASEGELLAESFGVPAEKVLAMARRIDARDVSLDSKVFEDGQTTMVDTIEAEGVSQEERFAVKEERARLGERLREALSGLDGRERYIVERRMMADDDEELSLADIGRELGVSRERARQLESRVKRKLRARLSADDAHSGECAA